MGCDAAGNRSACTHASGNAAKEANPIPYTITRNEPASGEPALAAGFWALRTIPNSGANDQRNAAQKNGQYGHTNGSGVTVTRASPPPRAPSDPGTWPGVARQSRDVPAAPRA